MQKKKHTITTFISLVHSWQLLLVYRESKTGEPLMSTCWDDTQRTSATWLFLGTISWSTAFAGRTFLRSTKRPLFVSVIFPADWSHLQFFGRSSRINMSGKQGKHLKGHRSQTQHLEQLLAIFCHVAKNQTSSAYHHV